MRARHHCDASKPTRGNRTLTYGCYRIVLILHFVGLAVVLIITPKRIAQFFNDMALGLREMGWKGVVVVFACASGCLSAREDELQEVAVELTTQSSRLIRPCSASRPRSPWSALRGVYGRGSSWEAWPPSQAAPLHSTLSGSVLAAHHVAIWLADPLSRCSSSSG